MRKFFKLKSFIASVLICSFMAAGTSGCHIQYVDEGESTSTDVEQSGEESRIYTLRVWYSDENLRSYIQLCAADYEYANQNVDVILTHISEADYVDTLTKEALKKDTVDLYLIDNDKLEQVKLAGIAKENSMMDIYNIYNYSRKALDACTYQGTLIAYPLSFETSFLIYNQDYVGDEEFHTFEDIKVFADGYEVPADSRISTIFTCDLEDIFYNYGYLGAYLNIGGEHGDDKTKLFDITPELTEAVSLYQQLINFFYINIEDVDYYYCVNGFENSSIMFTVGDIAMYSRVKDIEDLNTRVIALPDMSESVKTAPMSVTTAVVVNPFSENLTIAESFAKYLTYTNAPKMYDISGVPSCRIQEYEDDNINHIYESYDKSVPKLKMMYSDEFYAMLEVAMHDIAGGAEDVQALTTVKKYLESHWGSE